jgi:exodeoxyribonuclease VII small subunit
MTDRGDPSLFGATAPDAGDTSAGEATDHPQGADVASLAFDQALGDLQAVVQRLEAGGLPLEESITLYERGVALHEHCARLLTDAELRVQRLVEQAGGALRALDFDPDDAAEG